MKKIFFSVLAIAAIAACTKSEVQYESPAEIGFAPAVKNVTKAAMSGDLSTANPDQNLGIWAFWNKTEAPTSTSASTLTPTFASYDDNYLVNALFVRKTVTVGDNSVTAWGGTTAYPWPTNGSLVFAGYTTPGADVLSNSAVSYVLNTDTMTFTNYTQSNGFDLCWFGRTEESYNNRISGDAIPVVLSHALSWLKFNVKGEGSSIGWKITQITLNDISSTGTGTCIGSGAGAASWSCATDSYTTDLTLFNNTNSPIVLSSSVYDIETTAAATQSTPATVNNDIIVIPQTINAGGQSASRTQHTLTITYQFPVGDSNGSTNWKTDTKTVNLDIDASDQTKNKWVSGTKYTYTLTFKANEILVSPSYGDWTPGTTPGITVE